MSSPVVQLGAGKMGLHVQVHTTRGAAALHSGVQHNSQPKHPPGQMDINGSLCVQPALVHTIQEHIGNTPKCRCLQTGAFVQSRPPNTHQPTNCTLLHIGKSRGATSVFNTRLRHASIHCHTKDKPTLNPTPYHTTLAPLLGGKLERGAAVETCLHTRVCC
jgi:hypothetical protein